MAAVVTQSVKYNTNYSINSAVARGLKIQHGTIALDDSYPTGGEAVEFGFDADVVICPVSGGYTFGWDSTNQKLLAYYADYDAAADGALIQVAAETDLSALTAIPYIAIGS